MEDQLENKCCEVSQINICDNDIGHKESPALQQILIVNSSCSEKQYLSSDRGMDKDAVSRKLANARISGCGGESSGAKTKGSRKLSLLSSTFKHTLRERSGSKAFNRVPKSTILEQSKKDWESFKNCEGLNEELKYHNRGKHGFIDRQEFLQRTDQRQFEIERELRSKLK